MNKRVKSFAAAVMTMATSMMLALPVFAADAPADPTVGKAYAAAIAIAIAAGAGAASMGLAISKALDGVARQPEASSKLQTILMLGLVFVETAIIYALIVAIIILFVL